MSTDYTAKEFFIVQVRLVQLDDCSEIESRVVDGYDDYQSAALACSNLIMTTGNNNRIRLFDAQTIAEFIVMYPHKFDTENEGQVHVCCGLLQSRTRITKDGKVESVRDVYATKDGALLVHLIVRGSTGDDRELMYFYDRESFASVVLDRLNGVRVDIVLCYSLLVGSW